MSRMAQAPLLQNLPTPEQVPDKIDPITKLGDHEQDFAFHFCDLFQICCVICITLGGDQPIVDADYPVDGGANGGGEQDHITGFDNQFLLLEYHCQIAGLVGWPHGT